MKLTEEQSAILGGSRGETMAKVMETLVRYGELFGADEMVAVTSKYNHLVTSFGLKALAPVYALMDQLIEAGAVSAERTENGVCLSCPFSPHEPFALAPAFVLCRAEQGRAVLDWKTEGAAEPAAPSEMD